MLQNNPIGKKRALIAVNLIGFMWFLMDDIDILRSMGYDVLVTGDNSFEESHTITEINRRGARFVHVPCRSKNPFGKENLQAFRQYRALIKENRFDAIICHTPIVGALVRIAAAFGKAKVIYMSHGLSWASTTGIKSLVIFKPIELLGSVLSDGLITINEEDFRQLSKMLCKKVYKVDGVGFDQRKYASAIADRDAIRTELGVRPDEVVILSIGEISARKNHITVLKALGHLQDKERYRYIICGREHGGTILSDALQTEAQASGVRLTMLGFRQDIERIVHCADIGAIPSVREGLGMAGLQQLSAGVPLVGTDVQGIRSYIKEGETGFLVEDPYDVAGFAKAIKKLDDEQLRKSMMNACVRMSKKFDSDIVLQQRAEIYKEILG